jgi:hypothetical protein
MSPATATAAAFTVCTSPITRVLTQPIRDGEMLRPRRHFYWSGVTKHQILAGPFSCRTECFRPEKSVFGSTERGLSLTRLIFPSARVLPAPHPGSPSFPGPHECACRLPPSGRPPSARCHGLPLLCSVSD